MAVTIKDVAKLAKVSTSTVSRVCNNNPAISRETQERVRAAMEELGYVPAAAADNGPRPIKMIGIILPPSEHDAYEKTFNLKAIRGISQICNQRGVASTVITGRDYEELLQSIRTLHDSGRIDGFIMLYSRKDDKVMDYLWEHGLLYVVVGKPSEQAEQTICVDNDNLLAGREATDYLYGLGHRRIAYLGGGNDFMFAVDRRAGYQLSLLMHQLPIRPEYCVEMEPMDAAGICRLEALLRMQDRPTAFVASDDLQALALERICARNGLRVPEDVSVISFNNSRYTQMVEPRLTTVSVNSYRLGQEAAMQVINHIHDPELPVTRTVVPHRIIQRDSCKKI